MQIDNLAHANQTIGQFVYGPSSASLPEALREELVRVFSTPGEVPALVNFTETIYANRSEFTPEALSIAVGLATYCTINGWFRFSGERGPLVCDTLKRDASEKKPGGGKWHTADNDPDPAPGVFVMPAAGETKADEPEIEVDAS